MIRSLILAIGFFSLALGVEALALEKIILHQPVRQQETYDYEFEPTANTREIVIEEWVPWTLMSVGAVIVIYNFAAYAPLGSGGSGDE